MDLPCVKVGISYTDFERVINHYVFSTWQDDWNGAVTNRLYSVKAVLGDWQSSYRRCRKDEIVLCCASIVYSDSSPHFGIILLMKGKIYLVESFRFRVILVLFLKECQFYIK